MLSNSYSRETAMHPIILCLLTEIYPHDAVSVLNINGFKVDRSTLTRIFNAHILKEERSVKGQRTVMDRENIGPLVDTLLAQFGQSRGGCWSCDSEKNMSKITPMENDGKQEEPNEPKIAPSSSSVV